MKFSNITVEIQQKLIDVVGDNYCLTEQNSIEDYCHDETEDLNFPPEVVVKPANTNEVSEIMKLAFEYNIPVTPCGARTGLSGGALCVYGGIALSMERFNKIVKIIKDIGDITVRSSLIDYNFKVSDTLLSNQAKLLAKVDNNDDFYTSSRGVNECNIVVSGNLSLLVEEVLKDEICISKQSNLSSISIKLPAENISIPGVYYFVFQRLSWEGINIYEVISTSNEFTILVNEEQVDKAFKVIKNLKNL